MAALFLSSWTVQLRGYCSDTPISLLRKDCVVCVTGETAKGWVTLIQATAAPSNKINRRANTSRRRLRFFLQCSKRERGGTATDTGGVCLDSWAGCT